MTVPVYLKTDPDMPRPTDPEFYLIAREGTYFCRNHPFFESDTPSQRQPRALAEHRARCRVQYPKLPVSAVEFVVGFFHRIYQLHESEAIVLLYWDLRQERYRLYVPPQKPTVWLSSWNTRSPMDVAYRVPTDVPPHWLLVGDMHSHADLDAYASYVDKSDERHRDGIHIVVGRVQDDPPDFHQELAVDGSRFNLRFEHIMQGYRARRTIIPQAWLDRVEVVVKRSSWSSDWKVTYYGQDEDKYYSSS
jgi:hypothetical protein